MLAGGASKKINSLRAGAGDDISGRPEIGPGVLMVVALGPEPREPADGLQVVVDGWQGRGSTPPLGDSSAHAEKAALYRQKL